MSDRFFVLDKTAPDYEDRLRAELDRIEQEQPAKFFIGDREVTAAEFSASIWDSMNRVAAAQNAAAAIQSGTYTTTLGASKAAKFAEVERVR